MRNNVECKRCPCGAILSLRESCKRCADAARARLHAEGVAAVEVWWLDSSPKPYQQDALRRVEQAKHEQPPAPHGFQLHGLRGARFGAVGSLDEWAAGGLEAWTRSQSCEPPPVGAEVTWDVAKADMQARSEARYRPVTARNSVRFRVHSEQLERANGDADEVWTADPWAFAHTVRWVRLA